jgi:hemerythrin
MPKRVLTWEEARHSVGVPAIDDQHRHIVARINVLYEAIAQDLPHDDIRQALADLVHMADEHFAFEEALMREHGFPDVEAHEIEHRGLIEEATNLLKALTPSRPARTAVASAYLIDWAEQHILHADKAIGVFLASKGLTGCSDPAPQPGTGATKLTDA